MQPNPDSRLKLPAVDDDSASHSRSVARHIEGVIRDAGGSISFAQFMQAALYAPGLGYYNAGATKIGASGDFITAPEISPLFGHVLARQVAVVLRQLGGGMVLEPGAGSGALAVALLTKLAELDALPERYVILEVSADLRQRQEERIRGDAAEFIGRVEWVSQLPQTFSGVVIANEVADALPVERFLIRDGNVLQARVELGRDGFAWRYDEAPALLEDGVRGIEADIGRQLEDGFESEISFALENWIADLATSLHEGLIFLIDYGVTRNEYYAAERSTGWLRCHFRHHAHDDPLILPGIQDLTAWVDFSAVAAAAAANGLDVAAYLTQAHFLINGGIEKELGGFTDLTVEQQVELSRQIKLLTLPAEMGENFKCMGLGRGEFDMPPALAGPGRAHRL